MHTTGPKVIKVATKYRPLAPVLREMMLWPDTPLRLDVSGKIVRQIDNAERRFASILD